MEICWRRSKCSACERYHTLLLCNAHPIFHVHRNAIEALKVIFNHDPGYFDESYFSQATCHESKSLNSSRTDNCGGSAANDSPSEKQGNCGAANNSPSEKNQDNSGRSALAADTEADHENSCGVATTPDQDEVDSLSALTDSIDIISSQEVKEEPVCESPR